MKTIANTVLAVIITLGLIMTFLLSYIAIPLILIGVTGYIIFLGLQKASSCQTKEFDIRDYLKDI